jgi:hypothetical protein
MAGSTTQSSCILDSLPANKCTLGPKSAEILMCEGNWSKRAGQALAVSAGLLWAGCANSLSSPATHRAVATASFCPRPSPSALLPRRCPAAALLGRWPVQRKRRWMSGLSGCGTTPPPGTAALERERGRQLSESVLASPCAGEYLKEQ